jgi:hypothetical protein
MIGHRWHSIGVPHSGQGNIPTPNNAPVPAHHLAVAPVNRALSRCHPDGLGSVFFSGDLYFTTLSLSSLPGPLCARLPSGTRAHSAARPTRPAQSAR